MLAIFSSTLASQVNQTASNFQSVAKALEKVINSELQYFDSAMEKLPWEDYDQEEASFLATLLEVLEDGFQSLADPNMTLQMPSTSQLLNMSLVEQINLYNEDFENDNMMFEDSFSQAYNLENIVHYVNEVKSNHRDAIKTITNEQLGGFLHEVEQEISDIDDLMKQSETDATDLESKYHDLMLQELNLEVGNLQNSIESDKKLVNEYRVDLTNLTSTQEALLSEIENEATISDQVKSLVAQLKIVGRKIAVVKEELSETQEAITDEEIMSELLEDRIKFFDEYGNQE